MPLAPSSNFHVNKFVSSGTVHIVYDEPESVEAALKIGKQQQKGSSTTTTASMAGSGNKGNSSGLKSYFQDFNSTVILNAMNEKIDINTWMKNYDEQVEREEKLIEAIRNQPDDDGWVKVIPQRGKRHLPPMTAQELGEHNEEAKKSRKHKIIERIKKLVPMYKHQRIEVQKERTFICLYIVYLFTCVTWQAWCTNFIVTYDAWFTFLWRFLCQQSEFNILRAKFEQDKKKIEKMKEQRKFKPKF